MINNVKEKKREKCVLYDRDCIDCGECEFCDLDPLKICDNCGKCLEINDFATIKIDSINNSEDDCEREFSHGDKKNANN